MTRVYASARTCDRAVSAPMTAAPACAASTPSRPRRVWSWEPTPSPNRLLPPAHDLWTTLPARPIRLPAGRFLPHRRGRGRRRRPRTRREAGRCAPPERHPQGHRASPRAPRTAPPSARHQQSRQHRPGHGHPRRLRHHRQRRNPAPHPGRQPHPRSSPRPIQSSWPAATVHSSGVSGSGSLRTERHSTPESDPDRRRGSRRSRCGPAQSIDSSGDVLARKATPMYFREGFYL